MSEKKVKWGVLGTATIAKNHMLPGFKQAYNAQLYAIAGRNPEKTKEYKQSFGFEKAYISYDALLDDPQVEAVYIPLPNHLHRQWAERAARKKKHILCEKPLSGTAAEVREMVELCRREGVLLMEGFAYLHSPAVRGVLEAVRRGAIGTPRFIESTFLVSYFGDNNIRSRRETLGGTTYDQGCYNISLILAILKETPVSVKAIGHFTDRGVDDYSSAFLEFPSGAKASAVQAMCSAQRGDRFFIYGDEGILEAPISFNAKGLLHYDIQKNATRQRFDIQTPSNYRLEAEQFGRCILEGEQPLVSNEFSILVAETMDKVLKEIGYR